MPCFSCALIPSHIFLRYKIIKDNNKLSGRGSEDQWPYYDVMDDLMTGDPPVVPLSLESSLPGTLHKNGNFVV